MRLFIAEPKQRCLFVNSGNSDSSPLNELQFGILMRIPMDIGHHVNVDLPGGGDSIPTKENGSVTMPMGLSGVHSRQVDLMRSKLRSMDNKACPTYSHSWLSRLC
jgi:hypothetical protein